MYLFSLFMSNALEEESRARVIFLPLSDNENGPRGKSRTRRGKTGIKEHRRPTELRARWGVDFVRVRS